MVVFKDGIIMKKSIIATVFAVAAVSVSCTKVPEQGGGISMVFHAGSEALTRTSLAEGNAVVWEPCDAISLFDPSRTNNIFTTEDSGTSADFAGEVSGQGVYYALYPYNGEAGISGSVISTVLPSSQEAEEGSFRTGLNLSVAEADAQDRLIFKNACALVKFTLGEGMQGIVKAVLQGNNGEFLAGPVEIDVSSETPGAAVIEKDGVAAEELELAGTFSAGADYYFVSVPVKLSKGLTLTLLDKEGKVRVRRGASEADLQAGHILNLGTLDSGSFVSLEKVDGVYHVYDAQGLVEWASKDDVLTVNVVLENDIDMSGTEWAPVGSGMQAGGYSGDFNGGRKSICGLEVNTEGDAGFFGGLASGAKVHDLRFSEAQVTGTGGNSSAGVIAGASLGVIEDCNVVSSEVSGQYAGAVTGNNSVQVNRCDAVGVSVTGTFSAGGIAGLSYGKIEYCTLSGESRIVASGGSSRAGGIVGSTSEEGGVKTSGRVLKCAVEGAFVSGVWAGGVAGENGFGIIAQCVVDGVTLTHASSESNARLGGIAGYNSRGDVVASYSAYSEIGAEGLVSEAEGGVVGYNNNSSANVYGCYSTHVSLLGIVSGDESGKGCIAGYTNGNVTSCYAVLPEGVDGIGLVGRYSGPAPDHCVAPGHKDYDILVTGVSDLQADDGSVWQAAEIWNITAAGTPEIVSDYVCNPPAAQMTETGAAAASRPDNSM